MPESAEELYARVVAAAGEDGRLPMPPYEGWDSFPWEVVDGNLVPKVLQPPVETEAPRGGESPDKPCPTCSEDPTDVRIWENERWFVNLMTEPGGMPLILFLQTKEHLDYPDMDDELASEYGRLSARLCRIMSNLPNVGRVHVCRWGDGNQHHHVWFIARPERFPQIIGLDGRRVGRDIAGSARRRTTGRREGDRRTAGHARRTRPDLSVPLVEQRACPRWSSRLRSNRRRARIEQRATSR